MQKLALLFSIIILAGGNLSRENQRASVSGEVAASGAPAHGLDAQSPGAVDQEICIMDFNDLEAGTDSVSGGREDLQT